MGGRPERDAQGRVAVPAPPLLALVDTSVWIESVVPLDEVVTCLPVVQEVLQGFRDERLFRQARDAILALPLVESPLDDGLFLEARSLFRTGRRQGLTIRSSTTA